MSDKLTVPLAAGGAKTELLTFSSSSVPQARSAISTQTAVAQIELASVGGSLCQNQALLMVKTGSPGSADVVLLDDAGREIDRATLIVEATSRLEVDRGAAGTLRFLAGSLQGVHATTVGPSGILVGTGAVHFTMSGVLAPYPDPGAAPPWWGGDAVAFTGTPGTGQVKIDSGAQHAELAVEVVDPAFLGALRFDAPAVRWPASVDVSVAGDAAGAPVFGTQCKWSWPFDPPEWTSGGWIGGDPAATYRFSAPHAGSYTATCAIAGRSEKVQLTFE